eukprot:TRINITY_DN3058_c0_g1_i1.p1 TRINITY_DN3058_c0_g1~~TRINITY_DN3058_c0_g1_i1.p1  ORF type:complete len:398 (-),score=109.03 TRINITY_DN3058_c0_g1_i1:189-1382(-)
MSETSASDNNNINSNNGVGSNNNKIEENGRSGTSEILNELEKVCGGLLEGKNDVEFLERNLNRLCYLLEKILEHGLNALSLFSTTFFWNYLEELDQCLPGNEIKDSIKQVKLISGTGVGRGRVFIRKMLNEGSLFENLSAAIWNQILTEKYYRDTAIIRHPASSIRFLNIIERLKDFHFELDVQDRTLDYPDYWERLVESRKRLDSLGANGLDNQILSSLSNLTPKKLTEKIKALSPNSRTLSTNDTAQYLIHKLEDQTKALEKSQMTVLELKVQIEKERKDHEVKVRQMQNESNDLKNTLKDLIAELSIYKSNMENPATTVTSLPIQYEEMYQTSFDMGDENEDEIISTSLKKGEDMLNRLNQASLFVKQIKEQDESMKEMILLVCKNHFSVDSPK